MSQKILENPNKFISSLPDFLPLVSLNFIVVVLPLLIVNFGTTPAVAWDTSATDRNSIDYSHHSIKCSVRGIFGACPNTHF